MSDPVELVRWTMTVAKILQEAGELPASPRLASWLCHRFDDEATPIEFVQELQKIADEGRIEELYE